MTATSFLLFDPNARLLACLGEVLDPEVGINIVDLGLVYRSEATDDAIKVDLTLTSRACPLGESVLAETRQALWTAFPDARRVDVNLVWEPPWSPDRITDRGLELLGRPRRSQ